MPAFESLAVSPSGRLAGLYGAAGAVYRWEGTNWTAMIPPTSATSVAIFGATGGDQLWACTQGTYSGTPQLHAWDGSVWTPNAAPFYSPLEGLGRLTGFRDPSILLLVTANYFGGVSYVRSWNGSAWDVAYRPPPSPKHGYAIRVAYQFESQIHVAGWLTYSFSTYFCFGPARRSDVRAITVGDVGSERRWFVGGPCLNENLGHIAMGLYGSPVASPVGDGLTDVACLEIFDDGDGSAVYAGGTYGIRRWSGGNWEDVGGGVEGAVSGLAVFDDGRGPALYVSGTFSRAGGTTANRIARWGRPECLANCDGSRGHEGCPTLDAADFICFLNRFAAADPRANCDRSSVPPVLNLNDFGCFLNHFAAGCL